MNIKIGSNLKFCVAVIITLPLLAWSQPAQKGIDPATFQAPPNTYGISCWWWWLNGNVTKEAITRDLEAMHAKGFSGASIVDAGGQNQQGNGDVPAGPLFGSPAWRQLFLHAVQEADRLGLTLSLNIQSGWNLGGPDITPAEATKHITWSEVTVKGPAAQVVLPLPPVKDSFFRHITVVAFPKKTVPAGRPPIKDLPLKAAFQEGQRSGFGNEALLTEAPAVAGEEDAARDQVVVISSQPDATGILRWQVPQGEWTVMWFGYTPSGAEVSTASGTWQGRVMDYMNAQFFNRYWDTHVAPLLTMIGPMAGKTLKYLQTDSWELGGINWSDEFAQEFKKRRGYDLSLYLPVMAGKIIQDRQTSNAFLADVRKTIGDCVAENHYKVFASRAAAHSMGIQPESAGPHSGPIDGLKNYGYSEVVIGEFWSPSPHRARMEDRFFVKQAASAAHIYNKRLVGAEAFTTIGRHWNDVPWATMKPAFDHEICSGLNLAFLHTFTCSPKEMGLPGQEYFAGTHINPNITWWDQAGAVFDYFKRTQYIMQQPGRVVTDVLYYYGDQVPNIAHLKAFDPASVLPGYDYDVINEDRLLALSVTENVITLPHGVRYRVLVLPDTKTLSMAALARIKTLVTGGATVVGARPEKLISLQGYPQSTNDFQQQVTELWGTTPTPSGSNQVGKGTIIWGKPVRDVLADAQIAPDLEVVSPGGHKGYDYIHKVIEGADVYFLSSQHEQGSSADFSFRVSGRQPELWNALTGQVTPAGAFRQENGRTIVPLQFDPFGSMVVVFRHEIGTALQGKTQSNAATYRQVIPINGPWTVALNPALGVPALLKFDSLTSWIKRPEKEVANYSGKGTYTTTFKLPKYNKTQRYFIVLNNVQDVGIARIKINGKEAGIVWCPPYRLEITSLLSKKENQLQIEVINSWRNRLVGDRELPADKRYTKTNVTIKTDWQRLDAGLLGPVEIISEL